MTNITQVIGQKGISPNIFYGFMIATGALILYLLKSQRDKKKK